jgi:parallel beta-helix repeat protein
MNKYFFKISLAVGVVILLTGIAFIPVVTPQDITQISVIEKFSSTWYVDDDGDNSNSGKSWDDAWRDIIYAIDNSVVIDGDTIWIGEGVYFENILIDKELIISGNGSSYTIIDGNYKSDVVKIIHDKVVIKEVTIQNSGPLNNGININAKNCEINECLITGNYNGINFIGAKCKYNTIEECDISNNNDSGILIIDQCTENQIRGCSINNNVFGVAIIEADDNGLIQCTFERNTIAGVLLQGQLSLRNSISGSNFIENNFGIYLYSGARKNAISSNNFINSTSKIYKGLPKILRLIYTPHVRSIYCKRNDFSSNYWDDWKNLAPIPRLLGGLTGIPPYPFIPTITSDKTPEKTPI